MDLDKNKSYIVNRFKYYDVILGDRYMDVRTHYINVFNEHNIIVVTFSANWTNYTGTESSPSFAIPTDTGHDDDTYRKYLRSFYKINQTEWDFFITTWELFKRKHGIEEQTSLI